MRSKNDARSCADADSYVDADAYERIVVKPFKYVLP